MRTILAGWMLAATAAACFGQEAEGGKPTKFRVGVDAMHQAKVTEAKPDGQLVVEVLGAGRPGGAAMTEGFYLALASAAPLRESVEGASLVRVQVVEVAEGGATLQVGKGAAEIIKAGGALVIFRPQGATTAQIKAAPDAAVVVDGQADSAGLTRGNMRELTMSQNNVKQIGLAMHNFHDVHRTFPPAVIHGPDGKPWHSWRVLVLPFLDQQPLYEAYRFDEPWDGPNNSKLLDKIPPMYRDPIHGEPMDYFTHYAAVTGKATSFPAEGISFDGKPENLLTSDKKGNVGRLQFSHIPDGTSNTLLVGSVSPGRKIPWMKPEDVTVGADFPAPGKPDTKGKDTGFAAPYQSRRGDAGVFLFADGSVQTITDAIPLDAFRVLLTVNDGIPTDRGRIPTLDPAHSGQPMVPVFTIEKTSKGVVAKMVLEEMALEPPATLRAPTPVDPPK